MLTREEVLGHKLYLHSLEVRDLLKLEGKISLELCDYWLEQNKEKKIEKLEGVPLDTFHISVIRKLDEIIDVINEMRKGK